MNPKLSALFKQVETSTLPGLIALDDSFKVAYREEAEFDLKAAGVAALMAVEYFAGNEEASRQLLEEAKAANRWPLGEPGEIESKARQMIMYYVVKADASDFKKYRTWCRSLATEWMAMFYDRSAPAVEPGEKAEDLVRRVWRRDVEDFIVEFARSLGPSGEEKNNA
jgi:hypothetical protein